MGRLSGECFPPLQYDRRPGSLQARFRERVLACVGINQFRAVSAAGMLSKRCYALVASPRPNLQSAPFRRDGRIRALAATVVKVTPPFWYTTPIEILSYKNN